MNTFSAWLTGLFIGVIIGLICGVAMVSTKVKNEFRPMIDAIEKCEQNIPRNQICVLNYEAKVKQ